MKRTYNIIVEDLEKNIKQEQSLTKETGGEEACFQIIKNEYDHAFDRGNKLDTKINIVLTFCGVILLFLIDLLKTITELEYPIKLSGLLMVLIYLLGTILVMGLYIYCLVVLISLIKPTRLKRLDVENIILRNLHQEDKETVYTYVSIKYNGAIKENNKLLEEKFNRYKKIVVILVVVVITAFILYFLNIII